MSNTQATLESIPEPIRNPQETPNSANQNSDSKEVNPPVLTGRARRLANLRPFPKGVSGNPGGRKKLLTDDLSDVLRKHKKKRAQIIDALIAGAIKGKIEHIRETFDRVDGPIIKEKSPQQAVQVVILPGGFMEDGPEDRGAIISPQPAVAVRELPAPTPAEDQEGEEE